MKRLLLAAAMSIVAAIVVPIGSAGAAETVECKFKGTAKFTIGLGLEPQQGSFTFGTSGGAANKCNGEEASVKLEGAGKLSCTVTPGLGIAGLASATGTLTAKKEEFKLNKFEFAGVGPTVTFVAEGTSGGGKKFKGSGVANFVETASNLKKCEHNKLFEVEFEATAAGTVE